MPVEGTAELAQVAGMSSSTHSAEPDWSALLPDVVLEVRQSGGRAVTYALANVDFLIGTLPGCDLRVSGGENGAVVCLVARHPAGVMLRKLSAAQIVLVNGRPASHVDLADGDRIQIGPVEILVHVKPAVQSAKGAVDIDSSRRELQDSIQQFRAELIQFQQDKDAFDREKAAFNPTENRPLPESWQHERTALLQALDERDHLLAEQAAQLETQRRRPAEPSAAVIASVDLKRREDALAAKLEQHDADVLRLNRWQGTLEQREKDTATTTNEVKQFHEQLLRTGAEMETQIRQIDEWRAALSDQAEELAQDKQEQEELTRSLSERIAATEVQQATMSVLRSRLERLREEIRVRQQELDEQSARQEAREVEIAAKTRELGSLQSKEEANQRQYEQDRQQWLERGAVMDTAVRQMKQAQDQLALNDERVRRATEENERHAATLAESETALQVQLQQIAETRERVDVEMAALRERSVNLLKREQACEALQEQLRRRADEIEVRHQEIANHVEEHRVKLAEVEELKKQLDQRDAESTQQLDDAWQDLEAKASAVNKQQAELAGFEERYQEQINQTTAERRLLSEEQGHLHLEQAAALKKLAEERALFETMKAEAEELILQLPDAELRAGTALDRLTHARTQMREHLQEIHRYVRQCREELEQVRARLQTDFDKLRADEEAQRRGQDEHQLALTAFRQQLIDWQAQTAELRRLLARDETRLERKKVQVDERARAMEEESQRLAKQAEVLEEQEREVADLRLDLDEHLVDMRDWYRRKLRDLAGMPLTPDIPALQMPSAEPCEPATTDEDGEPAIIPVGRGILSLGGSTDPGDQKLGEVLRDSQLIDTDTLTALLADARRQRRSLRQVLLASGVITLYQLALIEAGNMQGLMIGPVRVVDRLRHSPLETVYRVFDPRRGAEAVLRHLSEASSADAGRADDFRTRFEQARLNDPHLANTLEIFDLLGRPAVLQEWLVGLPATDWPALTAAPGVCYRLLTQAAQGLATAHQAGVVHGRLSDPLLLLTGDGVLKITGIGEPAWLAGVTHDEVPTPRDDLRALGTIVSGWCTPSGVRKGAKTKPLPEALVTVLYRLAADGGAGYHDVRELLLDLEKAGSEIPPNAEAWDRLLKYVREHGATATMVRRSA